MGKKDRFSILEHALIARHDLPMQFSSEEEEIKYKKLLQEKNDRIANLKEMIVKEPDKILINLLSVLVDGADTIKDIAPRANLVYRYAAKHLLASLNGVVLPADPYLTMEQFCVEDAFNVERSIYFRLWAIDENDVYESIYRELLEDYLDRFRDAAATACHMIYLGVPMYVLSADGSLVEDRHSERHHFIRGMGKNYYPPTDFKGAPDWMDGLHLKRSDIDRHNLIFSQPEPPTPEEEAALIQAYRVSLGLPKGDAQIEDPTAGWGTRMSDFATSMIRHFEGLGHKRSREGDWPLQKEVVYWLTNTLGLSNREAEAIDLVTRPDHLRTR